jgi:hypothetical protein
LQIARKTAVDWDGTLEGFRVDMVKEIFSATAKQAVEIYCQTAAPFELSFEV